MKILYIDPWCGNGSNLYYYSTGLVGAMADYSDVVMVTQKDCNIKDNTKYKVLPLFFPKSSKMRRGIVRTFTRGLEYILSYIKILDYASKNEFDIIHIEWPLMYKIDSLIFKSLKGKCKLLSLKAHNIMPHSTGVKYLKDFKKIYDVPDIIIVHGENMKKEFVEYYPQYVKKLRVQHDGTLANFNASFSESDVSSEISSMIEKYSRIYLFVGRIDQDKGIDRFAEIWKRQMKESKSLLIIAGKIEKGFDLGRFKINCDQCENIFLINQYIPDNLLNYLMYSSNLVVLPYLRGSMSAVAITAAEFSKPVLSTKFGVIEEYVRNEIDGYVVENNEQSLERILLHLENDVSNETLLQMGGRFKKHLNDEFNWDVIGKKLVVETYMDWISKEA